ncbi:hypothetical protein ACQEVB_23110 [Pseudonocardia sp. CA-107938]|uniref:hypothetical protein n=1 Tax=Pseudonocardia sp. CA-107938 TaxID=3240021 RepID=UPI003D91C5D6
MFRRQKPTAPRVRPAFVELTDARSGVSHVISEPLYAEGLATRAGTFTVVCQARVLPAPMTAGPGAPCPTCHTHMRVLRF